MLRIIACTNGNVQAVTALPIRIARVTAVNSTHPIMAIVFRILMCHLKWPQTFLPSNTPA